MLSSGITDKGLVRTQNQDTVFCSQTPVGPLPNLFIVADGMGGHNAGDVASREAVNVFCGFIREYGGEPKPGYLDLLVDAAVAANTAVYNMSVADDKFSGMGTTFSACVIAEGKCEIIHIGDSRIYMITDHGITQLTTDHSYVNEMVRAGKLTPQQASNHPKRNILTRVMGTSLSKEFDGYPYILEDECAVLLCSDGLTNMLDDDTLFNIINRGVSTDERARVLIEEANKRGGIDNISVVLIDTKESGEAS
jgi:protein phosphatase